jgi:hypothetical protein
MPPKREFDPSVSKTAAGTLANFMQAPITGDLTEIPNVGAKGAEALKGSVCVQCMLRCEIRNDLLKVTKN